MLCDNCICDMVLYKNIFKSYIVSRFGGNPNWKMDMWMWAVEYLHKTRDTSEYWTTYTWNGKTFSAKNFDEALLKVSSKIKYKELDLDNLVKCHIFCKMKFVCRDGEKVYKVDDFVKTRTIGNDGELATSIVEWMIGFREIKLAKK